MDVFFGYYLDRLQELHAGIASEIKDLSIEALDWSPGAEMNSISVLVTHVTGSERFWIGDVAGRDPSNRNRDSEFLVHGLSADALQARLQAATEFAAQNLDKLSLQDMHAEWVSPESGKKYTGGYALLHALEYMALHLGHIQITRQEWEHQHQ